MGATAVRWTVLLAVLATTAVAWAASSGQEEGRVVGTDGRPVEGALVTVIFPGGARSVTVYTDSDGRFSLRPTPDGVEHIEARGPAGEAAARARLDSERWALGGDLVLAPLEPGGEPPASAFLAQLPDGDRKRRFIVDCGGCHTFGSVQARKEGRERTEAEWRAAIDAMLALAGPGTGFPIISGEADAVRDAGWLASSLSGAPWPGDRALVTPVRWPGPGAELTEYPVPVPGDLPHDLAVSEGGVVITGMLTHQMYVLDPETGAWETEAIPVQYANPRAVDIDAEGRWVAVLGAPQSIAVHDPASGEWLNHPVGTYPHSIALDGRGGAWFNGHFSTEPEIVGRLDLATGDTTLHAVPGPGGESTIPYGLRVGPDGQVWGTQLRGNRLVRLDPRSGRVDSFELPTSNSGPRRPDVSADGTVWIPEFGAGKLAAFDPVAERFTEYDLPVKDAGPYVVRVDNVRNRIWIGTGHGDVVAAFDPATEAFTLYVLPTRGALIRHMDVDEDTGEVWAAYGASPGIPGKVLRIRP